MDVRDGVSNPSLESAAFLKMEAILVPWLDVGVDRINAGCVALFLPELGPIVSAVIEAVWRSLMLLGESVPPSLVLLLVVEPPSIRYNDFM